jgi:diamine N-acetyltransferase
MTVDIRLATDADCEALGELYEALAGLHREHLPDRFQRPEGPLRTEEFLLGRLHDPKVVFLVAAEAGVLVGYVQAALMEAAALPTIRPRRYVYVNEIVVRSEHQGRGIGRRLMADVEKWAAAQGVASIELGTYEFNQAAIEFYEHLGYATLHRRMNKPLATGAESAAEG